MKTSLTLSKLLVTTTLFGFAPFAFAKKHKAHEHGIAKLSVVVSEKTKAKLEFESPAESIYGFEHEAKSQADKKKRDEALAKFKEKISQFVIFDSALACTFKEENINPFVVDEEDHDDHKEHKKETKNHKHAEHAEFHASYELTCQKPLAGSEVKFAFQKFFPGLKKLNVQILGETTQNAKTISNDQGSVKI